LRCGKTGIIENGIAAVFFVAFGWPFHRLQGQPYHPEQPMP
jgi:hypothetical protein